MGVASRTVTAKSGASARTLEIVLDREDDGRWIAEVEEIPGALAYGTTKHEAEQNVRRLTFQILADRLENNEAVPEAALRMFRVR